jgi:hypothetical protein
MLHFEGVLLGQQPAALFVQRSSLQDASTSPSMAEQERLTAIAPGLAARHTYSTA